MRSNVGFAILLSLAAGVGELRAQQPVAADSLDPVELEGITVTVLRTPLPISRTPYAVSMNGGLAADGSRPGLGLDEALRTIPGVQVDNRYNYALGERISIRGFGARAQFGVRGVRVLVDGLPATFPDGQTSLSHVDLGFLSRAEVIRGPASSIYGGSAGGVIQLETIEPAPGEEIREAGVVAGADALLRAEAAVGAGGDRGSYLLTVSHQGYGGERDYSTARNLRMHASGRYISGLGDLRVVASAVQYDAENPGSLSDALLAEDRTQAFANNVNQQTGEEGKQGQVGATLRRAAGPGEWEISAYGIARTITNPIPASIIDLDRKVGGLRALYSMSGGAGSLAVGMEGAMQRDDRRNHANQAGDPGALTLDQAESVDDIALFTQASLQPTDRLSLLAGLRYDWYRFAADDHFTAEGDPDDSGTIRMAQASPSLGVSFRADPALNLYANVATAFETPTTTELANRPDGAGGFNPDLEPQRSVSVETGIKGTLAQKASYEVTAYTARITNALIPFEVESSPDRQFFRNAGSARHRGIEAGLRIRPTPVLMLRGAYTYTDARFLDYTTADAVLDDRRVPGVSPHRAEMTMDLSQGLPYAGLDLRYVSRTPVDDGNSAHSPAYVVTDLRAGARGVPAGRMLLEPTVGVSNVFDRDYNSSIVVNAFGRRYFEPAPGRAVHVGLRLRF